jgi:hypothetical protein
MRTRTEEFAGVGRYSRSHRRSIVVPAEIIFMPKRLPLHPRHPERVCWGCDRYCAADDLRCGNGSDRAQHPAEIFGDDWLEQGLDAEGAATRERSGTSGT